MPLDGRKFGVFALLFAIIFVCKSLSNFSPKFPGFFPNSSYVSLGFSFCPFFLCQSCNYSTNTLRYLHSQQLPIGFKKLCELIYAQIVNRFIREAEAWGMLESCVGGTGWWNNFRVTGGLLKVTCDGFAFIEICEQKDKTTQEKVV